MQGKNGSVFCYGATGAGKTHTMLGTIQNPGVMVLALKDLFSKIKQRSKDGDHVVRLSYLEVYNETVRDLLSPGRPLVLREDSKQVHSPSVSIFRPLCDMWHCYQTSSGVFFFHSDLEYSVGTVLLVSGIVECAYFSS